MLVPPFRHWYVSGAVPLAVTEKAADSPTVFVKPVGCVVMLGVMHAASTVKGALAPAVAAGPLVRVAVITTPLSALLYVTPLTVTVFCPIAIVPVRVPPSVPVP